MNAEATVVRDTKALRAPIPGRWSAPQSDAAIRAVVTLGMVPLRLLATRMGRRLAATTVLSIVLVGVVSALYDHADGPTTVQRPLSAIAASASKPASSGQAAAAKGAAAPSASVAVAASRPASSPQAAAVAWYAQRVRVSPDRVRALQQQRVNATTTKVLVMADVSRTDMATAFVTVKRAGTGWKVP
jgi:hypothetical protein